MVGPSGAGKGTLINFLTAKFPDKFGFSVSYTTRQPRQGEVNGVHYNFVTMDKFKEMIANDEFIEHCQVHDKMYGTAKVAISKVQAENKIPLLDIDVQGALKFEKAFPDSNFIAVLAPSIDDLKKRLIGRGTETEETMKTRLANAKDEFNVLTSEKNTFTYRVVNDKVEISKRTVELLLTGLYAEELSGKKTADLIADTPVIKEAPGNSIFKMVVVTAAVGAVAAGAFMFFKNKK